MAKELVLYFSVYGTAKIVAEEIAKQTGADLLEIEPVVPYDCDRNHYNALARHAKKEHDTDARPAIKGTLPIADYDCIYLGYPMWWYTFPMIIYTLFDQYDFSGKTIVPFNTHMGSRDGGTLSVLRSEEPNATVLDNAFVSSASNVAGQKAAIESWLDGLGEYWK